MANIWTRNNVQHSTRMRIQATVKAYRIVSGVQVNTSMDTQNYFVATLSDSSSISQAVFNALNTPTGTMIQDGTTSINGAPPVPVYSVCFTIDGREFVASVDIDDEDDCLLIGRDILRHYKLIMDFPKTKCSLTFSPTQ